MSSKKKTSGNYEDEGSKKIVLNKEQNSGKAIIDSNIVTILMGRAGTGKTQLAVSYAHERIKSGRFDRIVVTRPTVSLEELGLLPGTVDEKIAPWVQPIYHCFYQLENRGWVDTQKRLDNLEIAPLSYLRGRTFTNSIIIVDEAQNLTDEQMLMVLTRIGENSKMIICGDVSQSDLGLKKKCGLKFLIEDLQYIVNGMTVYELFTNHRSEIVDQILLGYELKNKYNINIGQEDWSNPSDEAIKALDAIQAQMIKIN